MTDLVEAISPAPAGHGAAGELIHNDDLLASYNVVDILELQFLRLQSIDEVRGPLLSRIV